MNFLDINREARVESMRHRLPNSEIMRRHDNLRRLCEKQVNVYERAKRSVDAQCRPTLETYHTRFPPIQKRDFVQSTSSVDNNADRCWGQNQSILQLPIILRSTSKQSMEKRSRIRKTVAQSSAIRNHVKSGHPCNETTSCPQRTTDNHKYIPRSTEKHSTGNTPAQHRLEEKFLFRLQYRNGKEIYIRQKPDAITQHRRHKRLPRVSANHQQRR